MATSSSTPCQLPSLAKSIRITISNSSAPFNNAISVSRALTTEACTPVGKPTTVATKTPHLAHFAKTLWTSSQNRVDAHRFEAVLACFIAEARNIISSGFRFEPGVVNVGGEIFFGFMTTGSLRMLRGFVISFLIATVLLSSAVPAFAQVPPPPLVQVHHPSRAHAANWPPLFLPVLAEPFYGIRTLSFYGRPQDKLANIAIGFAFGVIAGTVYVTYNAASNPRELYSYELPQNTRGEIASSQMSTPISIPYQFTF